MTDLVWRGLHLTSETSACWDGSTVFANEDLHPPCRRFTKSFAISSHTRFHPIGRDSANPLPRLTHLFFSRSTCDHLRVNTGILHFPTTLYHPLPSVLRTTRVRWLFPCLQRLHFSFCNTIPFSSFLPRTPSRWHHRPIFYSARGMALRPIRIVWT